ncbi:MAG TPA: hypothetical protein VJA16_24285 [Thermoanaerobaculia bacterium]
MTTVPKVLLGVGGCVVLLGVLAIGGTWWLWARWHSLMESGTAARSQGEHEGAGLDEARCLAATLDRLRPDPQMSFSDSHYEYQRLDGCLARSRLSKSFCEGAPGSGKIIPWAAARCRALDFQRPDCTPFLQLVAKYCSSPERREKEQQAGGSN